VDTFGLKYVASLDPEEVSSFSVPGCVGSWWHWGARRLNPRVSVKKKHSWEHPQGGGQKKRGGVGLTVDNWNRATTNWGINKEVAIGY